MEPVIHFGILTYFFAIAAIALVLCFIPVLKSYSPVLISVFFSFQRIISSPSKSFNKVSQWFWGKAADYLGFLKRLTETK